MKKAASSIDEYLSTMSPEIRETLQRIREAIKKEAPQTIEAIRYGIPTFIHSGRNLVHIAGYRHHIGFYPAPSGIRAFEKDTAKYRTGKGTLQFPLSEPIPLSLIRKIVKFRVNEEKITHHRSHRPPEKV